MTKEKWILSGLITLGVCLLAFLRRRPDKRKREKLKEGENDAGKPSENP